MTSKKQNYFFFIVYFILFFFSQNLSFAQDYSQELPEIYDKLEQKIDLSLSFTDDQGNSKTIADMFEGQSTLIITLNYFRCTTMCTYQFLNMADAFKTVGLPVGKGFTIASISFDETDNTLKAQSTRDIWLKQLGDTKAAWHFYTPQNTNSILALAKSLNFYFEADDEGNFSHSAGLFFINKDGVFKRYLYGIVYEPRDIKYAIMDTSDGHVGSMLDKISRKFIKYNSSRGKYE